MNLPRFLVWFFLLHSKNSWQRESNLDFRTALGGISYETANGGSSDPNCLPVYTKRGTAFTVRKHRADYGSVIVL